MKTLLWKLAVVIAGLALIDFAFGIICRYANSHAKGGDTYRHYYMAKLSHDDILIMGSSRALNHYNCRLIEDSTGMTVYNYGQDNNSILFAYGNLCLVTERYIPKLIVYDIAPSIDINPQGQDTHHIGWLKHFYDDHCIKTLFDSVAPMEKYKMVSQLYRYNTDFIQMISDCFRPMQEVQHGGFKPKYGKLAYEPNNSPDVVYDNWDVINERYTRHFIELCQQKNIQLILVVSPAYHTEHYGGKDLIRRLADEYQVPFYDYEDEPSITHNRDYFNDPNHLNYTGASAYTDLIIQNLKQYGKRTNH